MKKNMLIKMFLIAFVSFVLMLSFTKEISASNLYIDAALVNTDSFPGYLNVQYGTYYDNINLKVGLRLESMPSGYSSVPIIVSPKIYGITSSGNSVHLYTVPNIYYYLGSPTYQEYTIPNVYYLQPNYSSYKVVTYARPVYSTSYIQQTSYVYVDPTITIPTTVLDPPYQPEDTEPIPPTSTDFYLSGQRDIYLDEYQDYSYDLRIVNNSNQPLSLVSIQTTSPARLDIKGINYSSIVSPNSTGYATIRVRSSGVSSDYSESFEISVVGKYGNNPDIQQTYNVTYHIYDEYSTNDGSCRDISLDERYSFVFEDNQVYVKDLTINNESRDYDFEITDISLQDISSVNSRIISYPETINRRDLGIVKTEYVIDNINNNITTSLRLEIDGKLVRHGSYDRTCNLTETIRLNLKNVTTQETTSTNCSNIQIYAPNILQEGNTNTQYNFDKGYFIKNNSNQKFTIDNVSLTTTTNKATTTRTTTTNNIYAQSTMPLIFNINTDDVSSSNSEKLTIKVNGRFDDNTYCNYSDITKTIDFKISGPEDRCSQINLSSKIISQGRNEIPIINSTNKTFYVESFLVSNKHNLDATIVNHQQTIYRNDSTNVPINFSGDGSLEIMFKGRFEDGYVCEYRDTSSGMFTAQRTDYYLNDNNDCLINLNVPNNFQIKDLIEYLDFSIINNTSKGGRITITGQGLVVSPTVVYLGGADNFDETLTLSNYNNPKAINYTVLLSGCAPQNFITNVSESVDFSQRLDVLSYPQTIKPVDNKVNVSLLIKNNFNYDEDITIKITGFPNTWQTQEKRFVISARDTENVSLSMTVDETSQKKEYSGFVEAYKFNELVFRKPLTIDLLEDSEKIDVSYKLKQIEKLKNAYSFILTINNTSGSNKNLSINFIESDEIKNGLIIEGPSQINLSENEIKNIEYRLVSPKAILKDDLKINVVDNETNKVLEELLIEPEKTAIPLLTGFFSLGSTQNIFLILIIVLVVILVYVRNKQK
jgi:hypothetical protein